MTIAHDPPRAHGDCFRCVIASIFDLPADQVPHFSDGATDNHDEMNRLRAWLRPQGFGYFEMNIGREDLPIWSKHWQFHHVITGISPRGHVHACVGYAGHVAHDPHPEGGGVVPDKDGLLTLGFICRS